MLKRLKPITIYKTNIRGVGPKIVVDTNVNYKRGVALLSTIAKYFYMFVFQIFKQHSNFKNTPKVPSRGKSISSNFQFQIL